MICSSCGFRKIKKGKFIKCHRCKEEIHRDTNAAINILKRFDKGFWGLNDDHVLRRKRRKFKSKINYLQYILYKFKFIFLNEEEPEGSICSLQVLND